MGRKAPNPSPSKGVKKPLPPPAPPTKPKCCCPCDDGAFEYCPVHDTKILTEEERDDRRRSIKRLIAYANKLKW